LKIADITYDIITSLFNFYSWFASTGYCAHGQASPMDGGWRADFAGREFSSGYLAGPSEYVDRQAC
jgi:hypothetical protein